MRRLHRVFLALSCALAAPLAGEVVIVEEIIVKVNGDVVLRSEYDRFADEIRAETARDAEVAGADKERTIAEREKNILRDMIDQRLLIQKGNELGISVEAQVLNQRDQIMNQNDIETVDDFEDWVLERTGEPAEDLLDRMRENFLSQAVLGQEVAGRIIVTREEIEEYYNEHKEEYVRSEGVRLSQIFFELAGKTQAEQEAARKKAEEIHDRVHRGEPFYEMASRHSEDLLTKEQGGDIGIYRRGTLRKEIEDAVFGRGRGFITGVIEAPNGLLILRVEQVFREGLAELEEVQDEIRAVIGGPRYSPAIREYLTELRERAYIEIRPGYADSGAVAGMDTSWSDPAKLAPVTTTREEVLNKKKKRRLLWVIPLPGGGGKDKDDSSADSGGGL